MSPKGSPELPGSSGRNTSGWLAVNVIDRRLLQSSLVMFRKGRPFLNVFDGLFTKWIRRRFKKNATDVLGTFYLARLLEDVSNAANLLFQMAHNSLISLFMSGQLTPSFKASI